MVCAVAELELRRGTPADDQPVRELLSRVLPGNSKNDAYVMRWQYWENPYGPVISFLWVDGSRLACHYASVPVPLVVHGKPRSGLLGVDAATDPDYRGRGLFSKIIGESATVCVEEGYRVLFFFPAPGSALPSAADTPVLSMPLNALPLDASWLRHRVGLPAAAARLATRIVLRPPKPGAAREVGTLPEGIDALWDAMPLSSSIVKDEQWWTWRYAQRPKHDYRFFEHRNGRMLTGAAVTTTADLDGPVVYILEILATDARAASALVGAIVAAYDGAKAVGFRSTEDSAQTRLVRAAGLRRVPARADVRPPSLAVFEADRANRHVHELPWAWSWGDLDHL
jgi:hypothetical protein